MHHNNFLFQPSVCRNYIQSWHTGEAQVYTHSTSPVTSSQPLSSIRPGNRFSVWRDVFTAAVSSLQASRTFNKIACEETGREMMETPVNTACHCGLATFVSNAKGFDLGLVIWENLIGGKKMLGIWNVRGTVAELDTLACSRSYIQEALCQIHHCWMAVISFSMCVSNT